MTKKIVLISSGQPALNPRLVKEADSLSAAGYDVTVLYAYWNDWGTVLDDELLSQKKWKAIRVGGTANDQSVRYFVSRAIHKLANSLMRLSGSVLLAERAIGRSCTFLTTEAQKHSADLYIAHNLAALPAAVKAAKRHQSKCGFDAEDMHRYEVSNDESSRHFRLARYIEDLYLPQVDQFTTSSPLITAAYQKLYPHKKAIILRNVFPKTNTSIIKHTGCIKLFWFSQTIGPDRGIEDIMDALETLNSSQIELHLLGNRPAHSQDFIDRLNTSSLNINFHAPIPPDEIISFASQFDIGLALETGLPHNRDICLTNKIFTYIQSGLAVIASDTQAQADLLQQYPDCGLLYKKGNSGSLADCLKQYADNPEYLNSTRRNNFDLGQSTLNWENESRLLLKLVQQTLN
ncbi:glycosyltransferase family protein [Mucilaginibacter panaciglaebae]|uniref:Spore protein YkvP/CgeB glycosyl transferase-like domain-containing protein n=1 Tax=Mucilaginibacter panaciglaebae TaxID=502331 RepID=A0ABP7W9X4_9SPHI